jgi:hypothetical protein
MGKWFEQIILKRSVSGQKIHEETSLTIKEMQIKMTLTSFHPVRMAIIKNKNNNK